MHYFPEPLDNLYYLSWLYTAFIIIHILDFSQLRLCRPPSAMAIFAWKMMRTVLIQMKIPISDFSYCYFLRFVLFSHLFLVFLFFSHSNFQWIFHNNSKNKNWKKNLFRFSLYLALSASSIKTGSKLRRRRGRVCISLAGKRPICLHFAQGGFFLFSKRVFACLVT